MLVMPFRNLFTRLIVAHAPCSPLQMVFDWIVHRIRRSLEPEGVDHASLPHIGVLDIFGFESFEENGLEQLLINYGSSPYPLFP